MLHESCFTYMLFHELRTKSYLNYEFKGLKLIETWKKKIPHGKFWFVICHGFFLVNSCTKVTEKILCELYKRAFQKNTQNVSHFEGLKKTCLFLIMSSCKSPELGKKKILKACSHTLIPNNAIKPLDVNGLGLSKLMWHAQVMFIIMSTSI